MYPAVGAIPDTNDRASQPKKQSIHLRQMLRSRMHHADMAWATTRVITRGKKAKVVARILRDGLLRAVLVNRLDGLQVSRSGLQYAMQTAR